MKDFVAAVIAKEGNKRIMARIKEARHDYLDDDWIEEFDSFTEAYEELGNCVAERQICLDLAYKYLGKNTHTEDVLEFIEEAAEQLNINIDG